MRTAFAAHDAALGGGPWLVSAVRSFDSRSVLESLQTESRATGRRRGWAALGVDRLLPFGWKTSAFQESARPAPRPVSRLRSRQARGAFNLDGTDLTAFPRQCPELLPSPRLQKGSGREKGMDEG